MASPHGTPIWYELQTPDADAAKTFYERVVGWTIGEQPPGGMDYRMIQSAGGNAAGLVRADAPAAGSATRLGWLFYLGVDDVDASVAAIADAGGSIAMGPFDIPGIGRIAKVADPQSVAFYVMRGANDDAQSDVFSPVAMGRTSWNELTTTDPDAAMAFYTVLFGWHVSGVMPMGAMGDYTFMSLGNVALGGAMRSMAEGPPPAWTFYFRGADVDASVAAIKAGGGAVHVGPVEVPGGDHVVMASDPHGAAFGVVGARGTAA